MTLGIDSLQSERICHSILPEIAGHLPNIRPWYRIRMLMWSGVAFDFDLWGITVSSVSYCAEIWLCIVVGSFWLPLPTMRRLWGSFGLTLQDLQLHILSMGYMVYLVMLMYNKAEIVPDLGDQKGFQYKKNISNNLLHGKRWRYLAFSHGLFRLPGFWVK